MSSEFSITVHVASDVEQIRNRIVEHTIIFPPPYDIAVNDIVGRIEHLMVVLLK